MTNDKKNTLPGRLKYCCLNLLKKILLCIFLLMTVLIVTISIIPSLFIYLLTGNYSMYSAKNEHRTSVNHFNE